MKNLFTLLVLVSFSFGMSHAQSKTQATQDKVVLQKKTLKKVSPETKVKAETAESKMERSQRMDTEGTNRPVAMTDEYIDAEIGKLQKVMEENKDVEGFNRKGYEQRIQYLESRRPKK